MISLATRADNYYLCMAVSLICLSTLLTWTVWLAIDRPARLWLRGRKRPSLALMALLAVAGGIFPYQQATLWLTQQRHAREAQAHRDALTQDRVIAGISMPAGTVLRVRQPGKPDTFARADFPKAVEVAGLQARQIFRHLRPAKGNMPARETWSVALAADQPVQGWTCSRKHPVELTIEQDAPRFDSCYLAAGNLLDGQALPMGTWLDSRQTDPRRWLLSSEGSEPAMIEHMPLLDAEIIVDGQARIVSFHGLLAQETTRGDMTYPAGTRAATALNVPGAEPGDLLFSPPRGRAAQRKGQRDVKAGSSVLQAPDGTVRLVLDNTKAGVLDVSTMRIGP